MLKLFAVFLQLPYSSERHFGLWLFVKERSVWLGQKQQGAAETRNNRGENFIHLDDLPVMMDDATAASITMLDIVVQAMTLHSR